MKVTLNWLKQYVDFDWSPDQLADRLTMLGMEVERMKKVGGEYEGIVVAQILATTQHPNADRLSVCRVADGRGERQIVCGAKNYQVGDKVPLILPDHTLPAPPGTPPFVIKVSKMRGVESHGMLCSPKELGLADDAAGLMILPPEAKVGQPFAEFLGCAAGDVIYDLEITPNRPDWNSVIGIAREISALTANPLRFPELKEETAIPSGGAEATERLVAVRIEDAELCPRYIARVIRGVKIGPSPEWLRQALEKVGVRTINNVVDVTNYVMLESGQPLHAFDYHLLATPGGRPTIVVRRAQENERFTTLDGQDRRLTSQMLLIADETKAIALAGIMGGANSEINERTADVLLESAHFKPQNIRATSKQLDLRTESSYRFERGGDIAMTEWASRRAAQLILALAGGQLAAGSVDAYPQPKELHDVPLRFARTNQMLGIDVPVAEQITCLQRLGLDLTSGAGAERCVVRIPTFRVDLKREVDLIEEIARLYGIDRIPPTAPRGTVGNHPFDSVHDQIAEARRILTAVGLTETQGQTLISEEAAQSVAETAAFVPLRNALSSDMNVLRPGLLPGLLTALRHNCTRKNPDLALFEIGRVFEKNGAQVREQLRLGIALTGNRAPGFWSGENREAKCDLYDLKGVLDEFFEQFSVRGLAWQLRSESAGLFLESATVHSGKQLAGELGQLLPPLAKRYDLRDAVFLAEFNLELLLARRSPAKSFRPLPAFPAIRRDVAMLVPDEITHETVLNMVKQAKPENLENVELFDVFRGQNIPAGQKSVAYAFTYRHAERTLTDAEVNATHEKLLQKLRQLPGAAIRDGGA